MKRKITVWLKKQVNLASAQGVILGLSGGIDSAVVAALAKEALGKKHVLTLSLPIHSQAQDLADACKVATELKIAHKTIDLSAAFDNLIASLPPADDLARANLKPRLRMLTFYYFAKSMNYLVCGTGNKSELMAGYFTKYGDGGVDLLPIADLLKKDVVKLAKELGIPREIIEKPPTAGLWPGQTDEAEMGITYAELDDILQRLESKKRQVASVEKVNKVKKMIRASEHKRSGPKICYI